jgi:hypothetical protein
MPVARTSEKKILLIDHLHAHAAVDDDVLARHEARVRSGSAPAWHNSVGVAAIALRSSDPSNKADQEQKDERTE